MKLPRFVLFFAVALLTARLQAQVQYLVDSRGTGFTTHYTDSYNLGYEFTVGATPLNVIALGSWVSGGTFVDSHPVGLWDTSGNLLASVTFSSGPQTLINGFAYKPIAVPVTLLAGTNYVLSMFWPTPTDTVSANFFAGSNPTFNGVTLVGSHNTIAGAPDSSSFGFPPVSPSGINGFSWIGPTLAFTAVPEPSTYSLGAAATLALIAVFRRRNGRKS